MIRRYTSFVLIGAIFTLFLFFGTRNVEWRQLPQHVGLGEWTTPSEEELNAGTFYTRPSPSSELPYFEASSTQSRTGSETPAETPHLVDLSKGFDTPGSTSPYPIGKTKPPGSNYTRTLVLPQLKKENTNWVQDTLSDMLDSQLLRRAFYVVDDEQAELRPPKNKGHEVMVYLTYIIDHYDDLADVNIFMHAHRYAWHNNDLLGADASQMIRFLSPERVTREGYMNLRCHWDPGCPAWMRPGTTEVDNNKKEEVLLASAWAELFPLYPIPPVLAQPCCAQFAVSRERIQELSLQRWVQIRDWLLRTELDDSMSGRVFEYVWQFIFTRTAVHCPSASACYCDGYGFCFGGPDKFNAWYQKHLQRNDLNKQLGDWREQKKELEKAEKESLNGYLSDEERKEKNLKVPQEGKDKKLEEAIREMSGVLEGMKREAFERGRDPKIRALESGRRYTEGDGY